LLNDENEAQMEAFLARHGNFKLLPLTEPLPPALHGQVLRLTPRGHGTDGFFGAVMARVA
jgi:16S rRNA (cytosine967-C5)-methyltransferase